MTGDKHSRIVLVKQLDGSTGRVDLQDCITEQLSTDLIFLNRYLHKTPNKRWFIEDRLRGVTCGQVEEIDIDTAADILLNEDTSKLLSLRILEDVPDVGATVTPPHAGSIVAKCLTCHRLSNQRRHPTGEKERKILRILAKSKVPLSAAQIAERAKMKNDSHFRQILGQLVRDKIVVKPNGNGFYIHLKNFLS